MWYHGIDTSVFGCPSSIQAWSQTDPRIYKEDPYVFMTEDSDVWKLIKYESHARDYVRVQGGRYVYIYMYNVDHPVSTCICVILLLLQDLLWSGRVFSILSATDEECDWQEEECLPHLCTSEGPAV